MTRVTALALIGGMAGCAAVASGPYGTPVDANNRVLAPPGVSQATGLKVSAGEVPELSSGYLGAVEITFENPTPSWIQIDSVDLDFGSPQRNQNVLVPWGADIDAWRLAVLGRLAIDAANGQPARLVSPTARQMLAEDADSMSARDRQRWPAAHRGGVVALDAVGTLEAPVAAESTAGTNPAGRLEPFPPSHLLTFPIRVPPGLFAKRWILLYTSDNPPGGCMSSMVLGYTTSDKKHERIALPFKVMTSAWQFPACGNNHGTSGGPAF